MTFSCCNYILNISVYFIYTTKIDTWRFLEFCKVTTTNRTLKQRHQLYDNKRVKIYNYPNHKFYIDKSEKLLVKLSTKTAIIINIGFGGI